MAQPWRWWITGAAAVVWAAVAQMQIDGDDWARRSSRHSVEETVRRIEAAARARGLPLVAKGRPPRQPGADMQRDGAGRDGLVLVLGTDAGHTPVVQAEPGSPLQLPLTVWVRGFGDGGGGAQVHFGDPRWLGRDDALPPEIAPHVELLPSLIDAAIAT
jgi:hypothetical protein